MLDYIFLSYFFKLKIKSKKKKKKPWKLCNNIQRFPKTSFLLKVKSLQIEKNGITLLDFLTTSTLKKKNSSVLVLSILFHNYNIFDPSFDVGVGEMRNFKL